MDARRDGAIVPDPHHRRAQQRGPPLNDSEFYLTHPAVMLNLAAPGQRLVLRTTLNFAAETQLEG